jgi:replicative DNA helicase
MTDYSESAYTEPEYRKERAALINLIKDAEIGKMGTLPGIPSGIIALDRITNCWNNSTLNVIAGAPSMGCTSLLLAFMRNAVTDFKREVAFFSLQMPCQKLLTKWLSAELELPFNEITSGKLSDHHWHEISKLVPDWDKDLENLVRIVDTPAPTIGKIVADCRRLREEGTSLFLIDNINRITLGKRERAICTNRTQELSYIARRLKTLALELEAPFVVVSNLNRAGADRFPRPQLSDLRDSGAIENEADIVILLYRAEYYKQTEDEFGNSTHNRAELIVAKNTFGKLDTVGAEFISTYGRFRDLEGDRYDAYATPAPAQQTISFRGLNMNAKNANGWEEPPF